MSVMTVKGAVSANDLGITLSHEHLLINLVNQSASGNDLSSRKVTQSDLPLLLRNPYLMEDNLCLDSMADAINEAHEFKKAGGCTIVDCTLRDIGRDPEKLLQISDATGLNIVMGCGYYTYDTHSVELKDWPCEKIRDEMLSDLLDGVDDSKIKAGVIGEIGTSREIHPDEFKVLKASAMASIETGAAIQVHTYPWADNGIEAADFLLKNKVNPKKIVICHADVALKKDYIFKILERGVFVQFDNFGKEFKPDLPSASFAGGGFASDIERVKFIKYLLEKGFEKQILITNDICLKCLLKKYGGKGYSHIVDNIVCLLQDEGIPRGKIINDLLIKNPIRMFE